MLLKKRYAKMQNKTEQPLAPSQTICAPVAEIFGDEPGFAKELMQDPGSVGDVGSLTTNLRWNYAGASPRPNEAYLSGESAGAAIQALGCNSCTFAGVCLVKESLTAETPDEKKMDIAEQLLSAPGWLKVVRAGHQFNGVRIGELDGKKIVEAIDSGKLSRDEILGGVISSEIGITQAADLPELTGFAYDSQVADTALKRYLIEPINGQAPPVEVIDASGLIDHRRVQPASPKNLAILYRKFLSNIVQADSSGRSHILEPDMTMQKQIHSQHEGQGKLFEIRMSGKSRLYFTVTAPDDTKPCRVVIIGSHGDTEADQKDFIDASLSRTR